MAKQSNQKQKILYLMKILMENTDENHPMTMNEIIARLEKAEIPAERKSLYKDIETLREFGLDIETNSEKARGYYVAERDFELPELKLLVDAVQSSKFITQKKSMQLIKKLEGLVSVHDASQLQCQVFVQNRIKTMNETIYYTVHDIYRAISENVQISFQYFNWNMKGEKVLRHDGALYTISPWALVWDDENYYLVAFDEDENKIKHFRVDKMQKIRLLKERRKGQDVFAKFDTAVYTKKVFGMYGGDEVDVTLRCKPKMAPIIIDRFGRDVTLIPDGEDYFTVTVHVMDSPLFLAWIMGFGDDVEVLQPQSIREELCAKVEKVLSVYNK